MVRVRLARLAHRNMTNKTYRYCFPPEPTDGVMDLTADDRPFYLNSYSGEMSLDFPKAERKCKGGILAYVITAIIFSWH